MGKTTVLIDEALIKEALRATNLKTKKSVIEMGLKELYNGPQNSDSEISYTWEIKGGGPSGTNAKEVSAFI